MNQLICETIPIILEMFSGDMNCPPRGDFKGWPFPLQLGSSELRERETLQAVRYADFNTIYADIIIIIIVNFSIQVLGGLTND